MSTPVPPEADAPPFLFCLECAKSEHLKRFIGRVGRPNLQCSACLHTDEKCTPPEADSDLAKVIRSLIRLYYDEAAYNRHVGGDELETLLLQENAILKMDGEDGRPRDRTAISDFIYKATCDAYADYDKGISLFAGYFNGLPNLHLNALTTSRSHLFTDLRHRLLAANYFELETSIKPRLQELAPHLAKSVPAETVFFRARIGVDGRYLNFEEPFTPRRVYHPYLKGKIGAPPPPLAAAGRVNRQGVSFLYLATDEQTAAAEVRPHPGHFVSVVPIKARKILNVADFSAPDLLDFIASDERLDLFHLAATLNDVLATPVTPEERIEYTATQLVADLLRQSGFDGVRFKSSVGTGSNLCAFSPDNFEILNTSAKVIRVAALHYSFSDIPVTIDPEEEGCVRIGE